MSLFEETKIVTKHILSTPIYAFNTFMNYLRLLSDVVIPYSVFGCIAGILGASGYSALSGTALTGGLVLGSVAAVVVGLPIALSALGALCALPGGVVSLIKEDLKALAEKQRIPAVAPKYPAPASVKNLTGDFGKKTPPATPANNVINPPTP